MTQKIIFSLFLFATLTTHGEFFAAASLADDPRPMTNAEFLSQAARLSLIIYSRPRESESTLHELKLFFTEHHPKPPEGIAAYLRKKPTRGKGKAKWVTIYGTWFCQNDTSHDMNIKSVENLLRIQSFFLHHYASTLLDTTLESRFADPCYAANLDQFLHVTKRLFEEKTGYK